jgi:prolyl-tRNA editing enzyme YbaK/EbsC (Cys-tRNA(Pro) deacylase)
MEYHPVVNKIVFLLKENKYWFESFEHEAVRTSEEAAKIRTGYSLDQGAKAMIVRIKRTESDKIFVMLVVPANLRFDERKVKDFFGAKDIRFASEEEVEKITGGVLPGGVPPFGNLFGLEIIIDPKLLDNEKIIFNAGDRCFSVAMKSEDYVKLVRPQIESITS